jgi:hypothetical protein
MGNKTIEKQLIFELIRFKDYDREKIMCLLQDTTDFPWVLGQLLFNRVGGVAFYVLKQCDLLSKLNREFRNSLKSIYEMNKLKYTSFKSTLSDLSTYFKNVEFKYAFLKGSFLANTLYPEGLRTSNDFDVLINQNDVTSCSKMLKQNGFVQGLFIQGKGIIPATRQEIVNSRLNRGETVPFLKQSNKFGMDVIEIDLNFSLDYKVKYEKDIISKILEDTIEFEVEENKTLCTLSLHDFVIQLCVHLYKEAVVYNWVADRRDLSLYKFCDIYAFFYEYGNEKFFLELTNRIHQYELLKECYYAIFNTGIIYSSLYSIKEFDSFLESIKPKDTAFMKQIIYPVEKRAFIHNMSFIDWFFCNDRKENLIELKENA